MEYTYTEQKLINKALLLLESKLKTYKDSLSSPRFVVDYLRLLCEHEERELFVVLFLNTQNQLIKHEIVFQGTINSVSVHPREVVKKSLLCNANAVILAHNHPSGCPTPSSADRSITYQIMSALATVDIEVLDHIVIGHQCHVSLAELGEMPRMSS